MLGVWVTPTLNWRHQRRKLVETARERSEAILESSASPKQKSIMIQTSLKPYITYSFPLGIQSHEDLKELDSIIFRTAKRALRLPMSTPTGLVLEQQIASGTGAQSLLVDYVQLGTAYLVRALNDEGKLGVFTKAILKAQAARLGRLTSSQVGAQQAKYRLMRQVELIKSAGVTIETPRSHTVKNDPYTEMLSRKACHEEDPLDCLDIASLMSHIRLDPKLIGERKMVPHSRFHILTELGIQRLEDILCRSRKAEPTIIDASELKQRYGSKVTRKHQIALNSLTLLAHEGPVQAESKHDPIVFNSSASLPIELPHVNRTLLEADFARHKRSGSPTWRASGNRIAHKRRLN